MDTVTKDAIVQQLIQLTSRDQVHLDPDELNNASLDFYRKYPRARKIFQAPIPVAIVYPANVEEVAAVLKYANDTGINVIPRTGASEIERGLESAREPHIIVDGSRLDKILNFDPEDMQLTVQAGVPLKQAEDWLNEKGYTTGHLPQSQPLADFGGLVATRSIGQLSTLYGGIEDMVVGLEAVMPDGRIVRIKNVPRRSVGPDIRHVFIGNEGSIAFITEVTVKLFPYLPDTYHYLAYTVDTMREGFRLLRDIVATGYRPSVIRLYDAQDWSQFYPKHAEKPVLIFRTEGPQPLSDATAGAIKAMVEASDQTQPYEPLDEIIDWFKHLTWTQKEVDAEVNQLEKTPFVGFTTEVAANWHEIDNIFEAVTTRVKKEIPNLYGIGGHSSHSYVNGTNLYFVYAFIDAEDDPAGEMARYHDPINKIIVEETLKRGGTMSHHHGVGKARAPFIKEEYGSSYWVLKTLLKSFDPKNTMNAGNIIPLEFWDEPD